MINLKNLIFIYKRHDEKGVIHKIKITIIFLENMLINCQ